MNWPILLAQSTDDIKKIVSDQNNGTSVPDHAIARPVDASGNWFSSEYWFPESASTFSANIDWLFMYIFWVSLIFFAAIVGVMVHFCIKYRRKGDSIETEPSSSHNTNLEIAWSVGPSILLVIMFWYGAEGFFQMRVARDDAEEIHVTASRWNWKFTYPDGDSSTELHLVNNRPTVLVMRSDDVLHSLYIAAMRQKVDIVPGRYTKAYLEPMVAENGNNQFRLACTEYCGQKHSKMRTMVTVHESDERRKADTQWIEREHAEWENGERIYKINCSGCHSKTDAAGTGPAFGTLWAKKEETLVGGEKIKIDYQYVYDSIMEPSKHIVEGFGPGPISKMNSFKGKLSADDVNEVVAFLKYLEDPESVTSKTEGEVEKEGGDKPAEPAPEKKST